MLRIVGGWFDAEIQAGRIRDQNLTNPDAPPSKSEPVVPKMLVDRDGDAGNNGTGFGKPAKDLSVNFVPVPYPDYPPVYFAPPAIYGAGAEGAQKRGWVWVPLSFLFLVIGLALGYQTALTFAPELREREGAKAFALNVNAGRSTILMKRKRTRPLATTISAPSDE